MNDSAIFSLATTLFSEINQLTKRTDFIMRTHTQLSLVNYSTKQYHVGKNKVDWFVGAYIPDSVRDNMQISKYAIACLLCTFEICEFNNSLFQKCE